MERTPHTSLQDRPAWTPLPDGWVESTITRRFAECCDRHRTRVAVDDTDVTLTYGELAARAGGVAARLGEHGVEAGAVVAILADTGADAVTAVVGILHGGAAFAPLDVLDPPPRAAELLGLAGARHIVATTRRLDQARSIAAAASASVDVIDLEDATHTPPGDPVTVAPNAPASVFFTSGSTGDPKAVLDLQRNLLNNALRYTNLLRIESADRLSLIQRMSFSGIASSVFASLLNGATLCAYALDADNLTSLAAWVDDRGITVYHSVPGVFRVLVAGERRFEAMRVVRLEGDRASWRDVELFRRAFPPGTVLANGLGTTETGLACQFRIDHATPARGGHSARRLRRARCRGGRARRARERSAAGHDGRDRRAQRVSRLRVCRRPGGDPSTVRALGAWGAHVPHGRPRTGVGRRAAGVPRACRRDVQDRRCPRGARRGRGSAGAGAVGARRDRHDRSGPRRWRKTARNRGHRRPRCRSRTDPRPPGVDPPGRDDPRGDRRGRVAAARVSLQGGARSSAAPSAAIRPRADAVLDLGRGARGSSRPRRTLCRSRWRLPRRRGGGRCNRAAARPDDRPALLARASTVEELAVALEAGTLETGVALVPLTDRDGATPLVLVPAAADDALMYAAVARSIPEPHPVWALDVTPHRVADASVTGVAAAGVMVLREERPTGPYAVGGFCYGALVAIEMARLLRAEGDTVHVVLLGLLPGDAPRLVSADARDRWEHAAERRRGLRLVAHHLGRARRLPPGDAARYVARRARNVVVKSPEMVRKRVRPNPLERAVRTFRPEPLAGGATLVLGDVLLREYADDAASAWGPLADTVTVRVLAGDDHDLLVGDGAARLGRTIGEILAAASQTVP